MWTLRRPTDDYVFTFRRTEGPLLEWFSVIGAVLALVGIVALCTDPFVNPEPADGAIKISTTMQSGHNPYPFLVAIDDFFADARRPEYSVQQAAVAAGDALRRVNIDGRGIAARPARIELAAAKRL